MADFVDITHAWDEGILQDWYINSVDNTIPPIWTEEHISELCNDFYVIPRDIPAADVRPERHGYWKKERKEILPLKFMNLCICNICGCWYDQAITDGVFTYCPNCGAKMDGSPEQIQTADKI